MRSILKFLGILIVISSAIGAGYLAYTYLFVTETAIVPGEVVKQGLVSEDVNIKPVSGLATLDFWVNKKSGDIFYVSSDAKVTKARPDLQDLALDSQTLSGFNKIIPSRDGSRAIAIMGYPQNTIFAIYDAINNSWERLPDGVISADFNPAGSQIAYLKNSGRGAIFILDLNSKKTVEIVKLNVLDGELVWVKDNDIYLVPKAGAPITENIININSSQKTITQLASNEASVMNLYNKDDNMAIKLVETGQSVYSLILAHQIGGLLNGLPFLTIPSKCVFNKNTIYCAVPKNLPLRASLPGDYLKEKFYTDDVFVSYDTEKAGSDFEIIHQPAGPMDADHLSLRGNQLLFRNRYDGKIYSLNIKSAE